MSILPHHCNCPNCGNRKPLLDTEPLRLAAKGRIEALEVALVAIRQKAFDYLNSADVQKGRISVAGVGFLYNVMNEATAALKDGGLK